MLKRILTCAALGAAALLAGAEPAYVATPLRPRLPGPPGSKPFQVLPPEETGVNVSNVYSDPRMWGDRFRELTLGAVETGIAVADFGHSGMLDIFVVSRNGPCALYRQTAPFKFVNVAAAAGVDCTRNGPGSVTSATAVDINQDGWPDLYVCRFDAPNLLFVNNGDGTFTERSKKAGIWGTTQGHTALWFDANQDGWPDLYVANDFETPDR